MTVSSSEDAALSAKVQDKASISGVSRDTLGQRSASFSRGGNKRPPTLSDIATRMKLEDGSSSQPSPTNSEGGHSDASAPQRGRLGLAGRLNSSHSVDTVSSSETKEDDHPGSRSLTPRMVALGLPLGCSPNAQNQRAISISSSTSESSASSPVLHQDEVQHPSKGKGMPSLDEIRARMAKKGHSSPAKGAQSTPPAAEASLDGAAPKQATLLGSAEKKGEKEDERSAGPTVALESADKPTRPEEKIATTTTATTTVTTSGSPTRRGSMLPPASTAPLSSSSKNSPQGGDLQVSPNLGGKQALSKDAPTMEGISTQHPLQHRWTLYFDSKTFDATKTSSSQTVSGTPSTSSATSPWLTKASDAATVADAANKASTVAAKQALSSSGQSSDTKWEAALKVLGAYHTVETFMRVFSTIKRPSQLERQSNYHLFKNGIRPMWEDPANADGGKWTVSFSKASTNPAMLDRSWMWLVLALIGEELDFDDDVTGAVVSIRPKADRISLWIRGRRDVSRVNALGKKLSDLLEIEKEPGVSLEFSLNNAGSHTQSHSNQAHRQNAAAGYWSFNNAGSDSGSRNAGSSAAGGPSRPLASQSRGQMSSGPGVSGNGLGLGAPIGRTGGRW